MKKEQAGIFSKMKRHIGKDKQYTVDEENAMRIIQRCFIESRAGKEVPIELRMGENKMPYQEVATEDSLKSFWIPRLKDGLLSTEADTLVGDICAYVDYRSNRRWFKDGNSNDPYNLFCFEFLTWLTRDLSGASCNEETLTMVKARVSYLVKIETTTIFPPETGAEKTMLNVLVSLRTMLEHTVSPIINREIANYHARNHLQSLRLHGKNILNYGFQFLYYVLRKTKKTPTANITSFPPEIAQTKSGQLLQCLIDTPEYCTIFAQGRSCAGMTNPFANSENKISIPAELLEEVRNCTTIVGHLGKSKQRKDAKKTGIYEPFRENSVLLEAFVEMHALLVELARAFVACDEAYDLAGVGGDLLVYGESNQQINQLMVTLKNLCNALSTCHGQIKTHTSKQELNDTSKKKSKVSTLGEQWLQNYNKLPSINNQLEEALKDCNIQAAYVQMKAKEISIEERIQKAKDKTVFFAQTAVLLSNHIEHFLKREPTPQILGSSPRNAIRPIPRGPSSISASSAPIPLFSPRGERRVTVGSGSPRETHVPIQGQSPPREERRGTFGAPSPRGQSLLSLAQLSPRDRRCATVTLTSPREIASGTSTPTSPRETLPFGSHRNLKNRATTFTALPLVSADTDESANLSLSPRKSPPIMGSRKRTQLAPVPVDREAMQEVKMQAQTTLDLQGVPRSQEYPLGKTTTDDSIGIVLDLLKIMPNLNEVLLMNNRITAVGAEKLCEMLLKCENLQILNMAGNKELFADDCCGLYFAKLIKQHTALEQLIIKDCGLTLTSVGTMANAFRENLSLEFLDMSDNGLTNDSILIICNAVENHLNIARLDFSGNHKLTDDSACHIISLLKKNPNVAVVNVSGTEISPFMQGAIRDQINSNCLMIEDAQNPFKM